MNEFVKADHEIRLFVTVDGPHDAPPLLLSNSLGTDHSMWAPQIADFSANHRVARYDTRGHGASDAPDSDYSIAQLGRDALAVADSLGWDRFDFCGISMGAMTGLWLAINAGKRLRHLIAANGAPFAGGAPAWQPRIDQARSAGVGAIVEPVLSRWFTPAFAAANPDAVDGVRKVFGSMSVAGYVGCVAAIRDLDLRHGLANITVPTLLIGGKHDGGPPPAVIEGMATNIPGATAVILDAAHLSNIEAAPEFNQAVLAFLA